MRVAVMASPVISKPIGRPTTCILSRQVPAWTPRLDLNLRLTDTGADFRCVPPAPEAATNRNAEWQGSHPMGGASPKHANPHRPAPAGCLTSTVWSQELSRRFRLDMRHCLSDRPEILSADHDKYSRQAAPSWNATARVSFRRGRASLLGVA
jgi:hypothetical protein